MDRGNRLKCYHVTLVVTDIKRGERHESTYQADLSIDGETTLRDIVQFEDDVKKIWRKAINAARIFATADVEITRALYERTDEPYNLVGLEFDRWYTRNTSDISIEKGEEGIYLVPDTEYTPETKDLWLGHDIMHDLSI